jgi:hypothetical protein
MAITFKLLGADRVALAGTDLYTVPAAKCAVISTISVVNTHTAAVTLVVKVVIGGIARRISPYSVVMKAGEQVVEQDLITLGAGDKVQLTASVGLVLEAVVCGVERDA